MLQLEKTDDKQDGQRKYVVLGGDYTKEKNKAEKGVVRIGERVFNF